MDFIIEKYFSDNEISVCKQLYQQIVATHEKCQGTGMVLENDQVQDCECEAVFKYVKQLIYAGIPRRYWFVDTLRIEQLLSGASDVKEVQKMRIRKQVEHSYMITGLANTGKTALLSIFGKFAIWFGQHVFYTTTEDLLNVLRKDTAESTVILERVLGSQVLLIDDVFLFRPTEWAMSQLEHNFKKLYDNGVHLCFAGDKPLEQMKRNITPGLFNFFKKISGVFVTVYKGKHDLEVKSYMSSPLIQEAVQYFKTIL